MSTFKFAISKNDISFFVRNIKETILEIIQNCKVPYLCFRILCSLSKNRTKTTKNGTKRRNYVQQEVDRKFLVFTTTKMECA